MSRSDTGLHQLAHVPEIERHVRPARTDLSLLTGLLIAFGAAIAGVISTGVSPLYFLQPAAILIVLGGTLGVTLITTPAGALAHSISRLRQLVSPPNINRELLMEELVQYARIFRRDGPRTLEVLAARSRNEFLRHALMLSCDINDRTQLQTALETELRVKERQGETDAKVLEVAGGYAPTIGILGTVVGLIQVMRGFSSMQSVGLGIGTAFVSTIYGLALANLVLLPAAHRIRARVAEAFETQELILEGVLCIVDCLHPTLIRVRLRSFLRAAPAEQRPADIEMVELAANARAKA